MSLDLSIGIDLGSDTIKIAFAYKIAEGICYGKFDNKPMLTQIALPALAYFDAKTKKWLFCDEVGKGAQSSFITVVKIKSLISLLSTVRDKYAGRKNLIAIAKNTEYYYTGEHFPKFFFPARRKMLDNFQEMVDSGQTFVAKGHTPKSVCEQFFAYVEKIVAKRIEELKKQTGLQFNEYKIALVHPSSVGEEYVDCVRHLIKGAFKKEPHKILSSNKSLAIFAEHRKAIGKGDDFLVFDMAEEDISVARIGISGKAIIIDGKDGHNDPCPIGGVDVDEAIEQHLEKAVFDRETIGTPSSGTNGHIIEKGVYSKQYLLMKDIKKAKVIFSKYTDASGKFEKGVPVTLSWDLYIQRLLTRNDIRESIGASTDSGIARKIYDYVLSELKRPLNHNVKKIFISGGLTETYSLLDYLKGKLAKDMPQVKIHTFDDNSKTKDAFRIQHFEDSVFAPSVGGAIASLTNKEIKVVLSLSYATWVTPVNTRTKILKIFANRGDEVGNGRDFTVDGLCLRWSGVASGEELFSTFITEAEIRKKTIPCEYYDNDLVVGDANSNSRKLAQRLIDLKTVSGGAKGYLIPVYNGRKVEIATGDCLDFCEGMHVDKDGAAHPIVKNLSAANKYVRVTINGSMKRVKAKDVVISTNLTDFETSQG